MTTNRVVSQAWKRTLLVDCCCEQPMPDLKSPYSVAPDSLTLEYVRGTGDWELTSARVTGRRIKKDGQPGGPHAVQYLAKAGMADWETLHQETPQVVVDLALAHWPSADVGVQS